jgi:hypothetical protein
MNSFAAASRVEKEAMLVLLPYVEGRCGVDVRPELSGAQLHLQAHFGDIVAPTQHGPKWIEVKAEKSDVHGRLFLETWSNRKRWTVGWMFKSWCDWLWYFFVDECALYEVEMQKLRQWAFGCNQDPGLLYRFPEREQKRYDQMNDTWGRCVPIAELSKGVESFTGPIHLAVTHQTEDRPPKTRGDRVSQCRGKHDPDDGRAGWGQGGLPF